MRDDSMEEATFFVQVGMKGDKFCKTHNFCMVKASQRKKNASTVVSDKKS